MTRNWYNWNQNPAFETKMRNNQSHKQTDQKENMANQENSPSPKDGHLATTAEINIRGIKYDFPFINIRKVPREVLKTDINNKPHGKSQP